MTAGIPARRLRSNQPGKIPVNLEDARFYSFSGFRFRVFVSGFSFQGFRFRFYVLRFTLEVGSSWINKFMSLPAYQATAWVLRCTMGNQNPNPERKT
jgi:hypothetical protein